ncbi:MAG: hypothetical protein V1738_00215 [Patescibacteria group bacterium]
MTSRLSGYIMFIVGFVMLLINALGYIFDWEISAPAFTVLGLVFVVIGNKIVRGSKMGKTPTANQ